MEIITRYLKAVLKGAKNESQTEEKQGFGKDVQAWLEEEKEYLRKLASGLLWEIKRDFEKCKTNLKENNDSKKNAKRKKDGKDGVNFLFPLPMG